MRCALCKTDKSIDEIRAEMKKIEESGLMAFGDEEGADARGWYDALLWMLGERDEGWS